MLRANNNRNITCIRGLSKGKFKKESIKRATKDENKIRNLKSFDLKYEIKDL